MTKMDILKGALLRPMTNQSEELDTWQFRTLLNFLKIY